MFLSKWLLGWHHREMTHTWIIEHWNEKKMKMSNPNTRTKILNRIARVHAVKEWFSTVFYSFHLFSQTLSGFCGTKRLFRKVCVLGKSKKVEDLNKLSDADILKRYWRHIRQSSAIILNQHGQYLGSI